MNEKGLAPPPAAQEGKINNIKEIDNKFIGYNCSECESLIMILLLNENNIEFKCKDNNHSKRLYIKEYIEKMQKYNNKKLNEICDKHNKIYSYYCLNCNNHLCQECVQSKKHKNHNKEILIEIKPEKEEINIIKEKIENYNKKIKELNEEKNKKMKELENLIKYNLKKEKKNLEHNLNRNEN